MLNTISLSPLDKDGRFFERDIGGGPCYISSADNAKENCVSRFIECNAQCDGKDVPRLGSSKCDIISYLEIEFDIEDNTNK